MQKHNNPLVWLAVLAGLCTAATAQTPYRPTPDEIAAAYKSADQLDAAVRNTTFKTAVRANWQPDGTAFWYSNLLKDSTREYIYVDVLKAAKRKAFDQQALAAGLSAAAGEHFDGDRLYIPRMRFEKNTALLYTRGKWYRCDLGNYNCTIITDTTGLDLPEAGEGRGARGAGGRRGFGRGRNNNSPDQQWSVVVKNGNLWLHDSKNNQDVQYTTDGTEADPYGDWQWSPDSRYLVAYHIHPVAVKKVYFVLSSVANTTRGQLHEADYMQPGDSMTSYKMYVCDIAAKKAIDVQTDVIDFFGPPALHWREGDSRFFTYERRDRGHQRFRIIEVNAPAGTTRNIIDEQTKTFIYEQRIYTHYLPKTNEVIWSSEKDGWYHLYLVDALKGGVKNTITNGNWIVRSVDSVDETKREIWFTGSGMDADQDPYFVHYYRISFDGKRLTRLTTANGNHVVEFSPDKKYYVDRYSRVDMPPVSELHRTSDGKLVMPLEKADISALLATGIRLPEVFVAKGRDGVTDIWGIVCRPRNFDSTKKYPVIENIYAGPQDAFVPKNFLPYGEMQSMAELGFIVVQMDGMGTANRSKAFHDVCWQNLADAGFPDRILWIKALAAKYTYVDADRVGIYGTSAGGQNSLGGLLFHPEFYKVAVSACGCHDNRVDKQWWNEQWMGYPVGPHYAAQSNVTNAYKLKGSLLLIVGEADQNVPPESTFRVVDALMKADKYFDLLVEPGANHTDGGPYGRKKKRDFFVKHLLGVDPPERNNKETM